MPHNSKTKNYFHVKPTALESQLNYLQLSCLHQKPNQNRNEGKRHKNAKQKKLSLGNFAISEKAPDNFAISEFLAKFFCSLRVSHHFHPKTQILIPQHPDLFPKVVYMYMYSKGLKNTTKHEIQHHPNTI